MHNPSTRLLATWWMRSINLNLKNVQILAQHLWKLHHVALLRFGGWVPYCKEICSKVFQCLKLKIHLRIVHNLSSLRLLSQILKGLKRGFNNLFDFQKLLNRYRIEKWIHKSFTYLRSKNFVHNEDAPTTLSVVEISTIILFRFEAKDQAMWGHYEWSIFIAFSKQ